MNVQFAELLKRPDIEQADADYRAMLDEIRDKLVYGIGIAAWVPAEPDVSGSACVGEYADLGADGEIRRYSSGISPGNVPDAVWSSAVALVADIVRQRGFGVPTSIVDRPGDHEVSFTNLSGAELTFGTAVNTTLGLSTGCHLTAEAHRRGAPKPADPNN